MNSRLERIEREILDLQQRRTFDDYHSDWIDGKNRLTTLKELLAAYPEEAEIPRHAIVASIAALQSFHRGILIGAMTKDARITIRAAALLGEKYSLKDTLDYIGGGHISAPELVAHSAPANSVDDLIKWLTQIFDHDFRNLLSNAVDPYDRHSDDPNVARIVADVDGLLASLNEAFRLRHIFAHEAAPQLSISHGDATRLVQVVELWMDAVDGVLWMTVWKDEPLTQFEMNMAMMPAIHANRSKLANALRRLRRSLAGNRRRELTRNHREWNDMATNLVSVAYGTRAGSMWVAFAGSLRSELIEERAKQLTAWADVEELER